MLLRNAPALSLPCFILVYDVSSVSLLNLISLLSLVRYELFSASN